MQILTADTPERVEWARQMFLDYAHSLPFDLAFQGFGAELASLPGEYAPPDGALFVAVGDDRPAGCVAVRKWDDQACEMKRLYVAPAFRGIGLGRLLAVRAIEFGRTAGYLTMRLDTVPTMREARGLYVRLGFRAMAPYRYNPVEGTSYLELDLTPHIDP